MSSMFYETRSLKSLDLSNFDISNVQNMSKMFSFSGVLSITYGPKFVYKNNASVEYMYDSCPANKPTDTSWEGVLS